MVGHIYTVLRGPRKWVRYMAVPRYPRYPVSGDIAGQPYLQGYKYGGRSSRLGIGREDDNLTL
jgi:hypothetical protein